MVILVKMGHNDLYWAHETLDDALNSMRYARTYYARFMMTPFPLVAFEQNRRSVGGTMTNNGHFSQFGSGRLEMAI